MIIYLAYVDSTKMSDKHSFHNSPLLPGHVSNEFGMKSYISMGQEVHDSLRE